MKKILKFILVIMLSISLIGCQKDTIYDFDDYLDQLFLVFIGEDPLYVNGSLYNPEVYGLDDLQVEPFIYSQESEQEYYQFLHSILDDLEKFNDLTDKQQLSRDILIDYIERKLAFEDLYYYGTSLGSYLGYQAQLPIVLAEYRFDSLRDINYYFDYLKTTKQTFMNIIEFENEKIELGKGLIDPIINRIIEQCETFLSDEVNFLIPVFNDKIKDLEFLTPSQKQELITKNTQLVSQDFLDAYRYLADELRTMKGKTTHSGALANLEQGKEYYEARFRQATGSNMSVLEAKAYLENILENILEDYSNDYIGYVSTYMNTDFIGEKTIDCLIPYFMNKMEDDFPSLDIEINYQIKHIHDSLKENASPALYFISPIDDNRDEVIYINPLNFSELNNYTYQTIAHEGYPGHLYQNVYLKNTDLSDVRKSIHYVGYSEAWATYVENYVIKYAGGDAKTKEIFQFYDTANYLILGLLDIGINYEGWSIVRSRNFLKQYFDLSNSEINDIYYDLIEVPTNYLMYYFSYYQLQDIKTNFKAQMGNEYSDLLFHTIFLETGPSPFHILAQQYENYE